MEVFLCVRPTLDWRDEARVEEHILPRFRARFELWNDTFAMSYAAFRARLWQITLRNLQAVEGAEIRAYEEVEGRPAWIVPIDDDDWLAPNLATLMRRALGRDPSRDERAGVRWIREVVQPPRRRRRFKRWLRPDGGRFTCSTNDYAVRGDLEGLEPLFHSHVQASGFFDAAPDRLLRISHIAAIQNRNLSSQTALGGRHGEIDRAFLLARYGAYRRFYSGWRIRRELRWAQPCIDGMAQLMEELRPR